MGQHANIGVSRIMLKGKGNTVHTATIDWDAMIKPRKTEPDTVVSIRVPQPLIDAAKGEAAKRGIPYQRIVSRSIG
jgi:hypothetical protein